MNLHSNNKGGVQLIQFTLAKAPTKQYAPNSIPDMVHLSRY